MGDTVYTINLINLEVATVTVQHVRVQSKKIVINYDIEVFYKTKKEALTKALELISARAEAFKQQLLNLPK